MSFTIYGINGQAESGKDLVADWMCQHLGLVKVSFADPMKRFAMQVFDFTEEQLWGPSKSRNDADEREHLWMSALPKFNWAANELISAVIPEDKARAYVTLMEWFTKLRKENPTLSPRICLQTLGTEWGRQLKPDMWLRYAYNKIVPTIQDGLFYHHTKGLYHAPSEFKDKGPYKGVVIADHRFINEIAETRQQGGIMLRVKRKSLEERRAAGVNVGIQGHQSETEQNRVGDAEFHHVFNFEEGIEKVYAELQEAFEKRPWVRQAQSLSLSDEV